jgi:ADP-ribose pyrophosphatase YjhB (NUDIX family)
MHFIQKHILDELREHGHMRYAALQPEGIESSHFRYHLKELERDGYVVSPERGVYELTAKGQHHVDRLSRGSVNLVNMPKVITYTLLTHGDSYLLQVKDREPYKGLLNMIGGKVHESETTAEAAVREVREKAGIEIDPPALTGVFEVIIRRSADLLTHAIAYVYTAEVTEAPDSLEPIKKTELITTPNLAPDTLAIIGALTSEVHAISTIEITI